MLTNSVLAESIIDQQFLCAAFLRFTKAQREFLKRSLSWFFFLSWTKKNSLLYNVTDSYTPNNVQYTYFFKQTIDAENIAKFQYFLVTYNENSLLSLISISYHFNLNKWIPRRVLTAEPLISICNSKINKSRPFLTFPALEVNETAVIPRTWNLNPRRWQYSNSTEDNLC